MARRAGLVGALALAVLAAISWWIAPTGNEDGAMGAEPSPADRPPAMDLPAPESPRTSPLVPSANASTNAGHEAEARDLSPADAPPRVTVVGRLVDASGRPVAGTLSCLRTDGRQTFEVPWDRAGPDGSFAIVVLKEGPYRVHGQGTSDPDFDPRRVRGDEVFDLGTGRSAPFEVRFGETPPELTVVVSGPGVVRGQVRDDQGAPTPSLRLHVRRVDPHDRKIAAPEDGVDGHPGVKVPTDAEGRFEAAGLAPGWYDVVAELGGGLDRRGQLLTPEPVAPDGRALALALTRPYLAIHVRNADGTLPPDTFTAHVVSRFTPMTSWPPSPGLLVTLAEGDLRTDEWNHVAPRRIGPGEFTLEMVGIQGVVLGVTGGEVPWAPIRASVPTGAGRVDVDVVIPDPAPTGSLSLDVTDRSGQPVVDGLRVRVSDPLTGAVLLEDDLASGTWRGWPRRLTLPAGTYRVEVAGRAIHDARLPRVEVRRVLGAFAAEARVTPGEDTAVHAVLGAGARLHVLCSGQPATADEAAVRELTGSFRDGTDERIRSEAARCQLRLVREGGWPEPVWFFRDQPPALGPRLDGSVGFGEELVSEPLAPGAWILEAMTPGGRLVRRPVLLVEGQTHTVHLAFP